MLFRVGRHTVDFTWIPLLVFILLALGNEDLLIMALKGPTDPDAPAEEGPIKILTGIALLLTFARWHLLSPFLRNLFLALHAIVFFMVLESFYRSGSPLQYPHVFSKVFVLYFTMAIYTFLHGAKVWVPKAVMLVITALFLFDLLVYNRDILSISAFMAVERGFSSYSTHLLVLPFLFFFNRYLTTRGFVWLLLFFMMGGFVLFLNHRSVWLAAIVAVALNGLYLTNKGRAKIPLPTFAPIFVIPFVAITLITSYVLADNPELVKNIQERVDDISKAEDQGTGKWRLEQFKSYLPFILDHPFIGMRFEGYELPNQFISEKSGKSTFDDATGHHFHSYYVDILFYGGLIGLALLMAPIIYLLRRAWVARVGLSGDTIALVAFCGSGLIYGSSYLLDYYFWGTLGMALAVLDSDIETQQWVNYEAQLTYYQTQQAWLEEEALEV